MSTILDASLYDYGARVKGKVVLITGGAAGIGRSTALKFAEYGGKIVIGDLNVQGAQEVVEQITKDGGSAVCIRADVFNWDDQVALFELAIARFHSVDVVFVNAGVGEEPASFQTVKVVNGLPAKPNTKPIEINLVGAIYTTHLAIHYLRKHQAEDSLKAIVLMGSMGSWQSMPRGELYCASKHGILGLGRSLTSFCDSHGIRISIIHPWYSDTTILPAQVTVALAGIPLTPVGRIVGAVFYSTTEPDRKTNGSVWLVQSNEQVLKLEPEILTTGVYQVMDERIKWAKIQVSRIRIITDVVRVVRRQLITKKFAWILVPIFAASFLFCMVK